MTAMSCLGISRRLGVVDNLSVIIKDMGSGKGRQRRAQTSKQGATHLVTPTYWGPAKMNIQSWANFIHQGGISGQRAAEYYSVRGGNDQVVARNIASELFHDLVAVGAIELPEGVAAGDFYFSVRKSANLLAETQMLMHRSGKDGPLAEVGVTYDVQDYLNQSTEAGGVPMQKMVYAIFSALDSLLRK